MAYSLLLGVIALLIALAAGRPTVAWLRRLKLGKAISEWGPASHNVKAGTPTMGGAFILATVILVTLAGNLPRFQNADILLPLAVLAAAGVVGLIDDLGTLLGRQGRFTGLSWRYKFSFLAVLGLLVGLLLHFLLEIEVMGVPWAGEISIGFWYVPIALVIIFSTTSAVAITDGLDGLAGGTVALAFAAYGVVAILTGQIFLTAFCWTVVGALLGFLWYNAHPAQVFMGDTGALALGTALATVALMTGYWLLLPAIGIVFVLNAVSDVIQIAYFKATGGQRVFRMTPLHHHFELSGWAESQVVTRFWLIGAAGALVGLALAITVRG